MASTTASAGRAPEPSRTLDQQSPHRPLSAGREVTVGQCDSTREVAVDESVEAIAPV